MATTPLPVTGKHAVAFAAMADALKLDPTLRRLGVSWHAWGGNATADRLPSTGGVRSPWIRLTPELLPTEVVGYVPGGALIVDSPLRIQVEIAVAGSRGSDALALWDALWTAAGALALPGVMQVLPETPATAVVDEAADHAAAGSFVLAMWI